MKKNIDWRKFPIHAVTGDTFVAAEDFFIRAEAVAASGRAVINLRAHGQSGRRLFEIALRLREITSSHGSPLVVAGRIDIAIASGADAVQLGTHAVPLEAASSLCSKHGIKFGYSCHSDQEAVAAQRAGAAYVYLGTVFSSASKPGIDPCDIGLLAKTCESVNIPVVAIGGISCANVSQVASAGASGAAAITSIWNAPAPKKTVGELAAFFSEHAAEENGEQ